MFWSKRLVAIVRVQWKTYVIVFFLIAMVSFPCIVFLGHYVWWRGLLLALIAGCVFVGGCVMSDYFNRK
jgi:hypothetical protein